MTNIDILEELSEKINNLSINGNNIDFIKCTRCNKFQIRTEYLSTAKRGYCKQCRVCRENGNKRDEKRREFIENNRYNNDGQKICVKCRKYKNLDQYISKINSAETNTCLYCRNKKFLLLQCEHKINKQRCYICNPISAFVEDYRKKIYKMLKESSDNYFNHDLGCTKQNFKQHIESKFNSTMNWNNYRTYWQYDHILPLLEIRGGDYIPIDEIKKRMHYLNIRPLSIKENQRKSNKIYINND